MKPLLHILTALIVVSAVAAIPSNGEIDDEPVKVSGTIVDEWGEPVPGASVTILWADSVLGGSAGDTDGRFEIEIPKELSDSLSLRISAVGHKTTTEIIEARRDNTLLTVTLEIQPVPGGTVTVYPVEEPIVPGLRMSSLALTQRSRQSLVPTNITGAMRTADIARVGSHHSAQIRVHGTSPVYYLNGMSIGTDPDHYGMFTIIPSLAVETVSLDINGTDASHELPSVVEMSTPSSFRAFRGGEASISTIDASASYGMANDRYFVRAAGRKSVLDKLVKYFNVTSDRETIPPTNFEDIVLASGWKVRPDLYLYFDQYHTNDYLSYSAGSNVSTGDVSAAQSTSRHFYSLRLKRVFENAVLQSRIGYQRVKETYLANPSGNTTRTDYRLDLSQSCDLLELGLSGDMTKDSWQFGSGVEFEIAANHRVDLSQTNWNFQPPFANSDNPYYYQAALNDQYGEYHDSRDRSSGAVFISASRPIGSLDLTAGVRGQYFGNLRTREVALWRLEASLPTPGDTRTRLFAGTFAEDPVSNILEPYQVIVMDNLGSLSPVTSRLFSATVQRGPWEITVFDKRFSNLPVLSPDFSELDENAGTRGDNFLTMRSIGRAQFRGLSVGLETDHIYSWPIRVGISYAVTDAYRVDHDISIPYELSAPHRFITHLEYQMSSGWHIGADISIHSGYPYTPSRLALDQSRTQTYSSADYQEALLMENSDRFPTSMSINLFAGVPLRGGELFLSVANVTNKANPIVNTASGYIHDAGVLPTIGYRIDF